MKLVLELEAGYNGGYVRMKLSTEGDGIATSHLSTDLHSDLLYDALTSHVNNAVRKLTNALEPRLRLRRRLIAEEEERKKG